MNNFLEKLSPREQYLALTAGGLTVAVLCMLVIFKSVGRIRDLDRSIIQQEDTLMNLTRQNARAISVDKAFDEVASQHSSAWTENEIFNKLRQEIYRLAQENPDAPAGTGKSLVEIPTLRQGTLKETGLGYREYHLNIRLNPADVSAVVTFCVRLQASQQSLRIDRLELTRSPDSHQVDATIDVTRIVVAGAPATTPDAEAPAKTAASTPPAEQVVFRWDGSKTDDWQVQGCDISIVDSVADKAAEGGNCLKAVATAEEARFFMTREIEAGATFELGIDATVLGGNAALHIMDETSGQLFTGSQELANDGAMYHYTVRFTVPAGANKAPRISVPYIAMKGKDCQVYVDNIELKKL